MVRETRHLWVSNLPKDAHEDTIREHFKRYKSRSTAREPPTLYGRVQSVRIIADGGSPIGSYDGAASTTDACQVSSSTHQHQQQSVVSSSTNPSSSNILLNNINHHHNNNNNNKDPTATGTGGSPKIASTDDGASTTPSSASSGGIGGDIVCICATVSFMDIKSASKAHQAEHKLEDRILQTEYYEPSSVGVVVGGQMLTMMKSSSCSSNNNSTNSSNCTSNVLAASATSSSGNTQSSGTQSTGPLQYSSNVPGTSRFLSNHGSSDDHSPGYERTSFYDRSGGRLSESETSQYSTSVLPTSIRRPNSYHVNDIRGRPRDRHSYGRNGSYATSIVDRSNPISHHRISSNAWYENSSSSTSRTAVYGNVASAVVQPDSTYAADLLETAGPTVNSVTKASSQGSGSGCSTSNHNHSNNNHHHHHHHRKKSSSSSVKKSRSSGSGSPVGSTSSRSRSHSRASSCSSTNSTSSNESGVGGRSASPGSRNLASAVLTAPANSSCGSSQAGGSTHADDNRPLAIRVRNLPARSSDTSLKDGLFHEYKKHGKVTWVKVVGSNHDRYALVCFKKAEDAEKALELSQDKLFFGCKIDVELYQSYDLDDPDFRAYEAELDEYHPKATRTLFIGNLEKDISSTELRKYFDCFGEIIDIDIKKQGVSAYAFCQYADIVSVVKAMRKMDGEHLGNNRIKLGFGKSMPTNCVWIDGISDSVSEHHLANQFRPFGSVQATSIDRERKQALVTFEASQTAQTAVKEMRGVAIRGRRIQIDFASRECQQAFYDKLEKRGERAGSVDASATVTVPGSRYNSCSSSSSGNSSSNNCNNNRYNATQENSSSASSSRSRAASFSRPSNPLSGAASPSSNSTGGGATPRTAGLRSRLVRYSTVPSTNSTTDYNNYEDGGGNGTAGDRRFRSYDEYSQGSSASHEDLYDHDRYEFLGVRGSSVSGEATDSPHSRLAAPPGDTNCSESKSGNRAVDESSCSSSSNRRPRCDKSPGDIKHLQKERYHLLEQLGEYPSSGDEISPKKRKYVIDHSSSATSNDHHHPHHSSSALAAAQAQPHENHHNSQRSIELRRLSEASLKQHTAAHSMHNNNNSSTNHRRPSTDSLSRHNSDAYSLLKRRKTEEHHHPSSGRGSRLHSVHSHEASGGESADGSRPGTPLCDEPNEPRAARLPRSVEPMYLPLPKFAEAMFRSRMNSLTPAQSALFHVSSLPPTLSSLTAPVAPAHATPASSVTASSLSRSISAPTSSMVPPAPVPETIPTSPPVRPPSHSSNTSDSEAEVNANAGLSESIKERLKSFEERFEKWAEGSAHNRRHSEQFQTSFRSKFLDLDLKEQSDIAKYMLEKKSIFDEDSKRLENIGDKYEPRDFTVYQPRAPPPAVPSAIPKPAPPATPAPNLNQLHQQRLGSGSPQVMSSPPPYSSPTSGTSTPVIKPLQYPFPSHPPAAKTVAPPASSPEIKNKMATLATPKPPAASSPSRVLMKSASLPSANVAEKATEDETKHRDRRKSTVDSSDSKAGDSEKESREKPEQPPLPSEDPQQKESERREAEERRRETEEQKRREELEATRRREIEEAKRREDELAKQQEEQRRKELEEARRKEEELKRREEEKRREAEQKRREAAEAEVKRREAEAEAKRQEAETKRREEDLKRREEESKRRAAERRETERREFDEAVKRREEEKLKAQEVQENKEKQREVKPEEEDYKTQKRRLSSPESMEDKKLKLEEKHRRSSKDNGKPKHRDERRSSDKMEFKHKQRSRPKENCVTKDKENSQENSMDKSFFDAIELRSSEDDERLRGRRESADKDDKEGGSSRKGRSKSSRRTMPNTSEDSDESGDNSKKHSIFDIPDDGPYVSMYDKVKARSCKNMQKQEEEKKIKAKFSKLKRSRAKREGKKRSTSWDEDSETDDDEPGRYPRQNKLASSSEDEPRRSGMYDSDEAHKFRQRLNDICDAESSETSLVNHQKPRRKISSRKNSRSARIASSDSSEDESKTKLKHELKLEMISDEEDFKSEPKKDDLKVVKSEFKTEKYSSEGSDAMKTPISAPAMLETKSACTFEQLFGHESSKKKHKKNKKRQKSFPLDSTDEDGLPLIERRDSKSALEEELKAAESRKKHGSSKKEKRREKQQREEERERKKIRKQKKPGEKHGENKMENIFGPLSDDDTRHSMDNKLNFDQLLAKTEAENRRNEESIKEESRKRKEKKRRDKRHRDEENSVDLDEAGRALEAQLMMSDTDGAKANSETSKADDVFRFSDGEGDNSAGEGLEKREAGDSHRKEKKKKKKRSKEEKHKHHHHGSSKDATAEPSPSLPCLLDEPKAPTRGNGMTSPLPITSSPIKKEKKADIFIPGFGGQIDDKIHEKAVLSIAQELETLKEEPDVTDAKSDPKAEPAKTEEKSRVVISVEETDNAVAALLGESFGTSTYDDIYDSVEEPQPSDDLPDQDDEEMKKAIQSLNTEELDLKPETPQSEHGLQIDTDDDEPTEPKTSVFDDPPKTPDVDMSQIKDAPASETKQEPLKPSSLASGSVNFAKSGPNVKQITVVQRPAIGSNATPLTKTLSIPITKFVPASKPLQTTPQVAKPASSPPANTSKFVMQPPTIKIPETFSGSGAAAASPPARSGVIKGGRGLLSPPHLPAASTPNAAPTTPKPPPPTQKPAVSFSQQPPLKSPAPVNNHTPLQMMRMPGSAPAPPVPTSRTPVPVGKPGPFPAKPAETQPMFGSPPQQPTTSHVPYQPLTRPHAAVPPPQPPVPATSAFARPPIPTSAPPVTQTFVPQQPPAPADSSKKELSEFDKLKSSDFDKLKSAQQKQGQPEEKEPEPKREEPKEEVPPKAPEPPQEPKGEEYWAAEDNSVIKKVEDEKPPVETKPEEPKAASEEPKEEEESDPKNGKPARRRKNTESEKTEDEGVTTRTTRKTAQAAPVPAPAAATPKRTPASRKKVALSSDKPSDIYEFHDDSSDETGNKVKTKQMPAPASPKPQVPPTPVVAAPVEKPAPGVAPAPADDFTHPSANTRKSLRLRQQEQDGRSTVDDIIEDVVRNSAVSPKPQTPPHPSQRGNRRLRQVPVPPVDPRKAPPPPSPVRQVKRSKDRKTSESMDSSDEMPKKETTAEEEAPAAPVAEEKLPPAPATPLPAPATPLPSPATVLQPVAPPAAPTPVVIMNPTPNPPPPVVTQKIIEQAIPKPKPPSPPQLQHPAPNVVTRTPTPTSRAVNTPPMQHIVITSHTPVQPPIPPSSQQSPIVHQQMIHPMVQPGPVTPQKVAHQKPPLRHDLTLPSQSTIVKIAGPPVNLQENLVQAHKQPPKIIQSPVVQIQQTQLPAGTVMTKHTLPPPSQNSQQGNLVINIPPGSGPSSSQQQQSPRVPYVTKQSVQIVSKPVPPPEMRGQGQQMIIHSSKVHVPPQGYTTVLQSGSKIIHQQGQPATTKHYQVQQVQLPSGVPPHLQVPSAHGPMKSPTPPQTTIVTQQKMPHKTEFQLPAHITQQIHVSTLVKPPTHGHGPPQQGATVHIQGPVQHVISSVPKTGPPKVQQVMTQGPTQQPPPPVQGKVIGLHQNPQILTGAVASPPLKHSHVQSQQPNITGASSSRVTSASISPQGQVPPRGHQLQGSLPIEASLLREKGGGFSVSAQSPPPAHQQTSPITPGDGNFIRGIPREYYFMYQTRNQEAMGANARIPAHLPRSPMLPGTAESNINEVDESMVASPPLELRRPPSGSLITSVPLSHQSPGDRATDSPYIHGARVPHYPPEHAIRFYENAPGARQMVPEPPPAHRGNYVNPQATPPSSNLVHLREREAREREERERMVAAAMQGKIATQHGHRGVEISIGAGAVYQQGSASSQLSPPQHRRIMGGPGPMQIAGHPASNNIPSHGSLVPAMPGQGRSIQVATPPHASQVPPQADSLLSLLQRYPVMWQGLLALKNDQAAVQMHFVYGNRQVAQDSLPCNSDGSTPPLRIAQRMRLEPAQIDGVARKMQIENEHCMLLALPCGRDHMDVLQQSNNLTSGFITYLQQKQAAGIVNIAAPGSQQAAYVVHIFPSCDFANDNLNRIAPDLLHRVADIAHLLIVIATV